MTMGPMEPLAHDEVTTKSIFHVYSSATSINSDRFMLLPPSVLHRVLEACKAAEDLPGDRRP